MINETADLHRVLTLPERDPPAPDPWDVPRVERATPCDCARRFGKPCIERLLGSQRAAMEELAKVRGLFGCLHVGSGKTAVGILAPLVLDRTPSVLLVPPGQVQQTVDELAWIGQHLRVPRLSVVDDGASDPRPIDDVEGTDPDLHLYILAYSTLSRPESSGLLERLASRLLMADEIHKLRHLSSATSKRVFRYLADRVLGDADTAPGTDCIFCGWSGTATSRSLRDFGHLMAFCLREGSPLPLDMQVLDQWADCFDAGHDAERSIGGFGKYLEPGEDPREGLRRRMFRTAGVVGSVSSAAENLPPLRFEVDRCDLHPAVANALRVLKETWTLPSGEELTMATEMWAARTQLLCGFHYKWVWAQGTTQADADEWVAARALWHRELRGRLGNSNRTGLDSPALVERAMLSGSIPSSERFERWNHVRSRVDEPDTEPVWIDQGWIERVVESVLSRGRGIVWYTHDAVGRALEAHMLRFDQAEGMMSALRGAGAPCVALSVKACGQGVDGLQRLYDLQHVVCPLSSGDAWEQLLGRLSRTGQDRIVTTVVLDRDLEYVAEARERARYVRRTMGFEQKLFLASGLEDIEERVDRAKMGMAS